MLWSTSRECIVFWVAKVTLGYILWGLFLFVCFYLFFGNLQQHISFNCMAYLEHLIIMMLKLVKLFPQVSEIMQTDLKAQTNTGP